MLRAAEGGVSKHEGGLSKSSEANSNMRLRRSAEQAVRGGSAFTFFGTDRAMTGT